MRTSRRERLSAERSRPSFPPGCVPSPGAEPRADPGAGRAPPARPLAPRPAPREGVGAEPAVRSRPQLTQESCRGGSRRLALRAAQLRSAPGMSSPRHPLLSAPLRPPQLSREGLPRRPRAGEAGRGRAARARSHSNGQTPGLAGGPRPAPASPPLLPGHVLLPWAHLLAPALRVWKPGEPVGGGGSGRPRGGKPLLCPRLPPASWPGAG